MPGTRSRAGRAAPVRGMVVAFVVTPRRRRACQVTSSGSHPTTGRPATVRVPAASSTPHTGADTSNPAEPAE